MADEDEDAPKLRVLENEEDDDGAEDVFDFRKMPNFHAFDAGNPSLPKRGLKDFETDTTNLQLDTLEASRQAMYTVLSWTRVHTEKNRILAMYHPESNMAYVDKAKTKMFQTMGQSRGGKEWLLPEEALFLIERGSMDCRWPVKDEEEETRTMEDGVPMSLQAAYAAFIGFEGGVGGKLTLEMYNVYAGLRRAGYLVFRSGTWDNDRAEIQPLSDIASKGDADSQGGYWSRFFRELWRRISTPTYELSKDDLTFGPLVRPGFYRNYADIYRIFQLVPSHDRKGPPSFMLPSDPSNPYRIHFDLYKTGGNFRKTHRGTPDFRVCVINARETNLPTGAQVNDILATTPDDPPNPKDNKFKKLKQGSRNVILAVVDNGIPSYIRIHDTPFSDEKLYERGAKSFRGKGRGGGRGGGRGRGRGRGRERGG